MDNGEDRGQELKITIIVEGRTEQAFARHLRDFLEKYLEGKMPKLDFMPCSGRIPKNDKLRRIVERALGGNDPSDGVIALTDVYTGTNDFQSAEDAKNKMRQWVGDNPNFYPHVAKHDFEAWLLPFWEDIKKLAGHNKASPGPNPEEIDLSKPPAYHIKEIFRLGRGRTYIKPRDSNRILKGKDLLISAQACPELKAFLNTILGLCKGKLIE